MDEDDSYLIVYNEEKRSYKYVCMKCGRDRATKKDFNKHREDCDLPPITDWTRGKVSRPESRVASLGMCCIILIFL